MHRNLTLVMALTCLLVICLAMPVMGVDLSKAKKKATDPPHPISNPDYTIPGSALDRPAPLPPLPPARPQNGATDIWFREAYSFNHHAGPTYQIGTTYYEQQVNSNAVPLIAIDGVNNAHIAWTKGIDPSSTTRHVYYNAVYADGTLFGGSAGIAIESSSRGGYCDVDLTQDWEGASIPVVLFHMTSRPYTTPHFAYAWDYTPLAGSFSFEFIPNPVVLYGDTTDGEAIWPHGCVSRDANGIFNLHAIVSPSLTTVAPYEALYNATWNPSDRLWDWPTPDPVFVPSASAPDSISSITSMFARSRISPRTVACYIHYIQGPTPVEDPVHGLYGMTLSKITCFNSADGITFDWATPIYEQERALPNRETHEFPDLYKLYPVEIYPYLDNEDHLFVGWKAAWMYDAFQIPDTTNLADTLWWYEQDTAYIYANYKSDIMIWSEETGETHHVYSPDFWGATRGGHVLTVTNRDWVQRPSLVATQDNDLICVWEQTIWEDDTINAARTDSFWYGYNDVSGRSQYANSEVIASISHDGGRTWSRPHNLTNTYTPFCSGEGDSVCWSERDPSIALNTTIIDGQEYFHLMYILDYHPGSTIYEGNPDNDLATNSPVIYQRVPVNFAFDSTTVDCRFNVQSCPPNPGSYYFSGTGDSLAPTMYTLASCDSPFTFIVNKTAAEADTTGYVFDSMTVRGGTIIEQNDTMVTFRSDSLGVSIWVFWNGCMPFNSVETSSPKPSSFSLRPNPIVMGGSVELSGRNLDEIDVFDMLGRPVSVKVDRGRDGARVGPFPQCGVYLIKSGEVTKSVIVN